MTSPSGQGAKVGEAYVEVNFDVDTPNLRRAANAAANRFGVNFGDGIERATNTQLRSMGQNLEHDFRRIGDRVGRTFGRTLGNSIRRNTDHRQFRSLLQSMNSEVDRFTSNLTTSLRLFNFAGILRPMNFLRAAIVGLIPITVALGSSIGQASLAATAGITGFFGLAGSIGAVALALQGPIKAFKAYISAQDGSKAAQERFKKTMDEMSPAGRQFVLTLISMRAAIGSLSLRLQSAALPGFTKALRDMAGLSPILSSFLTDISKQFGNVAMQIGALTKTPLFRGQLRSILDANEVSIKKITNAFAPLIQAIMTIAQQSTPQLIRFSDWLSRVILRFASFIEAKRRTGELAEALRAAGDEAAKWGSIIGNFVSGLMNIFRIANPAGQTLADKLLLISQRFREWTEVNTEKIRQFFEFFAKIDWKQLALTAATIGTILTSLRLLATVGGAMEVFAALFNPAGALILGIGLMAAGFFLAYTRVKEFRDALNPFLEYARKIILEQTLPALTQLWNSIVTLGRTLRDLGIDWQFIGRLIGGFIVSAVVNLTIAIKVLTATIEVSSAVIRVFGGWWRWLWDHILKPIVSWITGTLAPSIGRAIDQAKGAFDSFRNSVRVVMEAIRSTMYDKFTAALQIAGRFREGFLRVFDTISGGVRGALNAVIRVINSGINLVNKILPKDLKIGLLTEIGAVAVQRAPTVQTFRGLAGGGGVYGPGTGTSDSIMTRLSDGEHVWTAKEVRAAGGHDAVEDMRQAALHGFTIPGFAQGGSIDALIALGRKFGAGPPTSTYRPGDPLNHGKKLAVDFGGYNQDAAASKFLAIGPLLMELIHVTNRGNYGIYGGRRYTVTGGLAAEHRDHIHVAASIQGALAALGGKIPEGLIGLLGGIFDPIQHLKDVVLKGTRKPFDAAVGKLRDWGFLGTAAFGLFRGVLDGLIQKVAPSIAGPDIGPGPGGTVERWRGLVSAVLTELGVNTPGNVAAVLTSIQQESGGNPNAVQGVFDINSVTGDLARGLNQVIGATFRAYAGKYVGRGQLDPYANIYASVRYAIARYGSRWASVMAAPGGYDNGGLLMPGAGGINTGRAPEAVFTNKQFKDVIDGSGGSLEELSITLIQHDDYVDAQIARRGEKIHRKLKAGRVR